MQKKQTTYSEIDEIDVTINSPKTRRTVETNVTDCKNGQYLVKYKSDVGGDFNVSISVRCEGIKGSPFNLIVTEKTTKGSAVANSVLKTKQTCSVAPIAEKPLYDMTETANTQELVTASVDDKVLKTLSQKDSRLENEATIKWHEASDGFLLSGTFNQVTDSRVLLGQYFNSGGSRDEENQLVETESAEPEPQHYETTQKFFPLFARAHGEDLQKIENDFKVKVSRQIDEGKVTVAPCEHCTGKEFNDACEAFITPYQNVHQRMKMEQFLAKDQDSPVHIRQRIRDMGKTHPVLLEISEDRKHWQVYGEKDYVEKVLNDLEKENLISRKISVSRAAEAWERDEEEESDAGFDDENNLEHILGHVKLSVLKGDITDQHVDVIVNAASSSLAHGAGVAGAIVKKGGRGIQKESDDFIRRNGLLRDGKVAITGPGKLACKKIIHAVGPEWRIGEEKSKQLLKSACHESLVTASNSGFKSIALPAISSGIFGMPKDVCAKVMFDAVNEYVLRRDPARQTLTDIRFVNIDDPTVNVFKKEFINFFQREIGPSFANGARASNTRRSKRGRKGDGHPDHTVNDKHDNEDDPLRTKRDPPPKSFSAAVKGDRPEGADSRDGASASPKDSASGGASPENKCPICLDTLVNARTLKCKHVFCTDCLETALNHNNRCPVCKQVQGIIQGNQPKGEMRSKKLYDRLPGYYDCGTIVIYYSFPSGIQDSEHPNPGRRYDGTQRSAYLPDNREGREVLQLLKRAFDARLVFTVGTSVTTGRPNQVTWNDIHHKTNMYGGPERFGYPDPGYLRRVKEDLAAKGIC